MERLRALWDFDDLDGSERRFTEQLEAETAVDCRAEVLTQLARIAGMRGRFEDGNRLVEQAEALRPNVVGRPRTDQAGARSPATLGRRSRGGVPLFESAYEIATDGGEHFLAADAAHMAALVDPDGWSAWTDRGMATRLGRARCGPLARAAPEQPRLGSVRARRHEGALDAFELALAAREEDHEREYAAGDRALRRREGAPDARPRRGGRGAAGGGRRLDADRAGRPDGWFHEELAEAYAALGRHDEAREHATLAIPLLEKSDPSFAERAGRVRGLAGV